MKITVVGLGIKGAEQLTLAAVQAIREAAMVDFFPAPAGLLEETFRKWKIERSANLLSLYRSGDRDDWNYQRVFERILFDAERFGNVTVVVPGHPRIGVTVVQWLERHQLDRGYELQVLPGISSFCTMINDLKRDPLECGSVLLDANRLLLYEYQMDPRLDCYLYHVCSVGTTRVHLQDAARQNRLDLLRSYLLRFYSANHRVFLVNSPMLAHEAPEVREATIGDLDGLLPFVHFGTSLYIPANSVPKCNREYLRLLRNTQ